MKLVLLGPPGAGKGTQAKNIARNFEIPHISTGDIFRKQIEMQTPLGIKANEYIKNGQLVPDEITISIIRGRIMEADCRRGFLLDGFPRTILQADTLKQVLYEMGTQLDHVINIKVSEEVLLGRLTERRVCASCGASYNIVTNPPMRENICNYCGTELVVRDDDGLETVKNRLFVYTQRTQPLIKYYQKINLLRDIDGEQEVDRVFQDICNLLGSDNK